MKKIIITTLLIISIANSYAFSDRFNDDSITVCPDVNQLQVDIMQGTAQAPGGWVGQSAIPLKEQDNWKPTVFGIYDVTIGNQAQCDYMSNSAINIVVVRKTIPSNYSLYSVQQGVTPVTGSCCDMSETVNAGQLKNCYWYSNSVLKK